MTQKDRLIELLHDWGTKNTDGINTDSVAEHLIENNVVVLPCKVGSILELRMYGKVLRYRFQGIRQQFANSKPELFGVQLFGERLGVSIATVDSLGKTVFIVEEEEICNAELDGRCVILPCTVDDLINKCNKLTQPTGDQAETYTTGYENGYRKGQAELIAYLLQLDTGVRNEAEQALKGGVE